MTRAAALAAAAALALAGCGEGSNEAEPETTTDVEFTLDADGPGGKPSRSVAVACESTRGARFCPRVDGLAADDLEPVPPETACTEIYGGPDVLTVSGTLHGEQVDAELTRVNGCEIERFDRFTPLLQELFPGYEPGASLG